MSNETEIKSLLEESSRENIFSAYHLLAKKPANRNGKRLELYGGMTSRMGAEEPVTAKTYYDLGSLTKVLCTTSIVARLVDRKALKIDQKVGELIPRLKKTPLEKLTLLELLAHASGLVDWVAFYKDGQTDVTTWLVEKAASLRVESPRKKEIYSDINFFILGQVLENNAGPLQTLFEKEVLQPLKIKDLVFGPVDPKRLTVAATEFRAEHDGCLQGTVFDENAEAMGGIAPHAGLFGTAAAVLQLGEEWMKARQGQSDWLTGDTAQRFTQRAQLIAGGTRAIGWDTKSETGSSAGTLFSKDTFGHLGYTGTSLWVDPHTEGIAVFLTNRVHPSRLDERIRSVRPVIHDAVARYWKR